MLQSLLPFVMEKMLKFSLQWNRFKILLLLLLDYSVYKIMKLYVLYIRSERRLENVLHKY
jgi:hypothetical protein